MKFVTQFIAGGLDVTGGAVAVKDGLPIGFSLLEILAAIDRGEQRRMWMLKFNTWTPAEV